MSVACLQMYDLPEVRGALDTFWHGLAGHLRREGIDDVPDRLTFDRSLTALLGDPDFWFGQCCGSDLVGRHASNLRLVATPHYDAPGCSGADYISFVVVREDNRAAGIAELRGTVCVVNEPGSRSGANALFARIARYSEGGPVFTVVQISGSHVASIDLVRDGAAGVAAIDCVTWALLERHRPEALQGLRVLTVADPAPGLPYVAGSAIDDDGLARIRSAIFAAFADPALEEAREALLLKDVEVLPQSAYDRIAMVCDRAAGAGGLEDAASVVQRPAG